MENKKEFYLERIESDIVEDSYEQGELDSTGCGRYEVEGKAFTTMDEMLYYLNKVYGLSDNKNDYDIDDRIGCIQTDKQVSDHSADQNGGWTDPTPREIQEWKEGRRKLYNEHFWIYFHKIAH